jgi:hypothetical protein
MNPRTLIDRYDGLPQDRQMFCRALDMALPTVPAVLIIMVVDGLFWLAGLAGLRREVKNQRRRER